MLQRRVEDALIDHLLELVACWRRLVGSKVAKDADILAGCLAAGVSIHPSNDLLDLAFHYLLQAVSAIRRHNAIEGKRL